MALAALGFRFPASWSDATCGDEILLFQLQTSSLILFRKQTKKPPWAVLSSAVLRNGLRQSTETP